MDALGQLAARTEGPNAAEIADRASQALRAKDAGDIKFATLTEQQRRENITVVQPEGATLPDNFVRQDWNGYPSQWLLPRCLIAVSRCDAVLIDLDDDGQPEILLFDGGADSRVSLVRATAFKFGADREWTRLGTVTNIYCPRIRELLRIGPVDTVPPLVKDIEINGQRLRVDGGCTPNR